MAEKVWLITGASRGSGRVWAEAALARGDKVAVTARDVASVAELATRYGDAALPLALDVTDAAQVRQAVAQAHDQFVRHAFPRTRGRVNLQIMNTFTLTETGVRPGKGAHACVFR